MEREISDLQALVAPSELDMVCPHCGAKVYPRLSRAGPHIRADCPECDRYIKACMAWNHEHTNAWFLGREW